MTYDHPKSRPDGPKLRIEVVNEKMKWTPFIKSKRHGVKEIHTVSLWWSCMENPKNTLDVYNYIHFSSLITEPSLKITLPNNKRYFP